MDFDGGLKMLKYRNLQFANATKFNDPFDCHPALFDYSNPPVNERNWPPADFLSMKGNNDMTNFRNSTWICCLSRTYDSLLMWAYYTGHKGMCIGLDEESVLDSLHYKFIGSTRPHAEEVEYEDIQQKPDYFINKKHTFGVNLLTRKSKEWSHEQEVRLITQEPMWVHSGQAVPKELEKKEPIDWKEIRHYPAIRRKCFKALYLGVKMSQENKNKIIEVAKSINNDIEIYQMTLDTDAFKLKEEPVRI